jgi:thioredoxin 1
MPPDNAKEDGKSAVSILTDSNFFQEVSKRDAFVVDFWAPWCGPCRELSPLIEELATKYEGKAAFGKVNVDENPFVSDTFGVDNIPAIFVFKRGRPVDSLVGSVTRASLEDFFGNHLDSDSVQKVL